MAHRVPWFFALACLAGAACSSFRSEAGSEPEVDAGTEGAVEAAPIDGGTAADAEGGAEGDATATTISPNASVACQGSLICSAPTFCCVKANVANTCETAACTDALQAPLACDEGTDCIGGAVCCARLVDDKTFKAAGCAKTCAGAGSFVVCNKTSGVECGAKPCLPLQTVLNGVIPEPDPNLFVCGP